MSPESASVEAALGEPSGENSALDQRKEELITENLHLRKGALGDGQEVSKVRQEIEKDFHVQNKGEEFELIKQMEKEEKNKEGDCPVTKSTFTEVRDYQSKIQDGRGGGRPNDCSSQSKTADHDAKKESVEKSSR